MEVAEEGLTGWTGANEGIVGEAAFLWWGEEQEPEQCSEEGMWPGTVALAAGAGVEAADSAWALLLTATGAIKES